MDINNLSRSLNSIDIDDLPYIEQDLSYYELVSLGFLLYGEEKTTAAFVLQKLLVMSNSQSSSTATVSVPKDLLRIYADKVNKENWRAYLVEALAIINARCVLRKLGFQWESVRNHYLPNISELSLHIHPILKALYKICEQLNQALTGRLIYYMDEHFRKPNEHLHFYDSTCLEVFLLDWITRDIINVGNRDGSNVNVQILCQYFKLHDLDELKAILVETINNNSDADRNTQDINTETSGIETSLEKVQISSNVNNDTRIDRRNCYNISFERAGYALIINQKDFHMEIDPKFKNLLPERNLKSREGSDVDKLELIRTFSLFGYEPIFFDNLKHYDMLHCIRERAKLSLLLDSFVVCILSHGFNGAVYGCNSVPVLISEIEETFTVEELNGKPKLLIVQACQTENTENNLNLSERKNSSPIKFADIFKAMSTVSGYQSFRNTANGSWFIKSLCLKINELGKYDHFADIMTAVVRDVAEKRGSKTHEVMLPMTASTLRDSFYLPQKTENN